jgi:hypothetical protein
MAITSTDTFCYYCQRDYGARLATHLRKVHPGTYAANALRGELTLANALDLDILDQDGFVAALTAMQAGLTFHAPSPYHRQVKEDGRVLVDWWPRQGTCKMYMTAEGYASKPTIDDLFTPDNGNARRSIVEGPPCLDFAALLAWMKHV